MNKMMRRTLSLLLCLVMVVGILPVSIMTVFAAGDNTTYVLAGSDFQPTDANTATGVTLLNKILDKVDDKYTTMDGFLFAGDYDYNYNKSANGKAALQSAVQAVYGTEMHEIYVQGNHDADNLVGSTLTASGANDANDYGVFVINEKDYMWYNDDEATIKTTAENLKTYLDAKRNERYTKPIFVMSHLPLHYCMRTQVGGGDGKHANYIFDVLNEAGEAGLNIIFMFGHNHSHGWDDPYGGAAIFLTKGDSINIAQNSTTTYAVETLNFTYMNAGYISYYRHVNQNAETDLSMTTFAITDSDVTIERYTADGLHDLKSAGVANTHATKGGSVDGSCSTKHNGNETYSPDTSVVSSAYTLTLNKNIIPVDGESTDPTTPETDPTTPETDPTTPADERTYTRVTNLSQLVSGGKYLIIENGDTDYFMLPESISNSAGDRVGYNIESTTVAGGDTITGDYSAKEWTMTGSGTSWVLSTDAGSAYLEYQSSSRAYGRISATDSSTFTVGGSADAYTFTTTTNNTTYVFDHSSAGLINGYDKDPSTTFYIYQLTNEGSEGEEDTTPPEGYTLARIEVVNQGVSKYFLGDALNTDALSVEAVYTKADAADFRRTLSAQTEENADGYTVSGFDGNTAGKQYITGSDENCVGSFAVEVFQKIFTNVVGDVTVEFTNYGITAMVATSEIKTVEGYSAYVTYDITPTGYTQGDEAIVTLTVDTALFDAARSVMVMDQGKMLTITDIVDGKVTFTATHFSEYDVMQTAVADVENWVEIPGETKTIFRLANSLTAGEKYLIVSSNQAGSANAVNLTGNSINSSSVTIIADANGNYIEAPATSAQWTYANSRFQNVNSTNRYLRGNNEDLSSTSNTGNSYTTWNYSDTSYGLRTRYSANWDDYYRYLRSDLTTSNSSSNSNRVYIYAEETVTTQSFFIGASGKTEYTITVGAYTNQAAVEAMIGQNYHVYLADDANGTNAREVEYDLTGTVNPSTAGNYTLTASYGGATQEIKVQVVTKIATKIEVAPMTGEVQRGSAASTQTGSTMTVTYDDESTETIPVTVEMLSGSYDLSKNGSYDNLTVSYQNHKVEGYTLNVVNVKGNDFPTYPNPGSIDLKKTATGVDFQNTGIARVELSTSGLPAGQGADVVIVIDTSSSMRDNKVGSSNKTRIQVLAESLEDMLVQFQTPNTTTGLVSDIDVAIIDFNGYFPSSAGSYDQISFTSSYRNNGDNAKVFTGTNAGSYVKDITLSASNFVNCADLTAATIAANFTNDNCKSGTNYDGALENAYKLLSAKKAANLAAGETRDQYVIFLSDGAPFRYNGANNGDSKSTYNPWNNWLTGYWANATAMSAAYPNFDYSYFYNGNGNTHPHRIAEAIKGDVSTQYDVVLREAAGNTPAYIDQYQGLGATIYSIGFGLADDGSDSQGGKVSVATQQELIRVISSGEGYYYENVQSADELTTAFTQIATGISFAAQNARFVDQMGSSFNLQMNPTIKTNAEDVEGDTTTTNTDITITTHPVYTTANATSESDIGKPYGTGTTVENVTFHVATDGTITATTTAGGYKLPDGTTVVANSTNILVGGVIYAKNFYYNSNTTAVKIGNLELAAETFQWNIGTINEKQYTISYTVYLEGSMDGYAPSSDSYATNNFAILYYTNHLGNEVEKSVASPSIAWQGAQVSYAFYLVDADGNPLYKDGTQAPNFLVAHKITQPVVYKSVELNKQGGTTLSAQAVAVLPDGYTLYAPNATYTVTIGSGDGQGSTTNQWVIANDAKKTTYITNYLGATDYSNVQNVTDTSYNYTDTVVYFAVVWTIGTVPDTVVVDFGLPVDVSVLANDMFGNKGTLAAVGTATGLPTGYTTMLNNGFGASYTGTYGTATVNGDKIRYTLSKDNGMQMSEAETLGYAVEYSGSSNAGYYYGKLTVIPATTIYYEDQYVTLKTYTRENTTDTYGEPTLGWPTNSVTASQTQGEDRPGSFSLGTIDANNIYGFDGAYSEMSTFSMGKSAMIHVDAKQYGTAEFTFCGTGFDIISVTSNQTGTLLVEVKDSAGNIVQQRVVDTYYGYTYGKYYVVYEKVNGKWTKVSVGAEAPEDYPVQTKDDLIGDNITTKEDGTLTGTIVHYTWKPVENNPNALYQIPVIASDLQTYGTYSVKISAVYFSAYDATSDPGYDLYLDAIRIYNPAGTTSEELGETIEEAYAADGELFPSYEELRNKVLDSQTFTDLTATEDKVEGIIFIDGNTALEDDTATGGSAINDYKNFGPNNELYLASGQTIVFNLNAATRTGYTPVVRIGMKNVGSKNAVAELWNVTGAGVKYNTISQTLKTATDMYYDITVLNGGTVVITNSGEDGSILSITNIKTSYKLAQDASSGAATPAVAMFSISRASANAALLSLAPATEPEVEPTVPETQPTEPETEPTVPETEPTVPETEPTVPETEPTEPETEPTEPETEPTEPETEPTEPETEPTEPETEPTEPETQPEQDSTSIVTKIVNAVKNVVNWFANLFRR